MSVQKNILRQIIRKNIIWILLFFILSSLCIISYQIRPHFVGSATDDFLFLIGYPGMHHLSVLNVLMVLYQICLTIYLSYLFYTYELENSFQNIFLRTNEKKWILYKSIAGIIFFFVFRSLISLFLLLYFYHRVELDISYFLYPILLHVALFIFTVTIINLFYYRKVLFVILSVLTSFGLYLYFSPIIVFFCSSIFLLFNFLIFKFQSILR